MKSETLRLNFLLVIAIQHRNGATGCIKFTDHLIEYIKCANAFRLYLSLIAHGCMDRSRFY